MSDDCASEPGGSDNDSVPQDVPINGWEEFDRDVIYKKKHVDPNMRQRILTESCRRTISDAYFNNPTHSEGIGGLFLKKKSDHTASGAGNARDNFRLAEIRTESGSWDKTPGKVGGIARLSS